MSQLEYTMSAPRKVGTTLFFRFEGTETRGEFMAGMSYQVAGRPAAKRECARLEELGYVRVEELR